jgi:hypothetical protein
MIPFNTLVLDDNEKIVLKSKLDAGFPVHFAIFETLNCRVNLPRLSSDRFLLWSNAESQAIKYFTSK